jgi:hypothetical protein
MFTLNWSDPQTFWLNVTNWVLLVVTAVCVLIVAYAAIREVVKRLRDRVPIGVRESFDPHIAALPDLGLTMADGGERVRIKDPEQRIFRHKK